jgi:hypothetical protein
MKSDQPASAPARKRNKTSIATAATQIDFFLLSAPQRRYLSGERINAPRECCNSR